MRLRSTHKESVFEHKHSFYKKTELKALEFTVGHNVDRSSCALFQVRIGTQYGSARMVVPLTTGNMTTDGSPLDCYTCPHWLDGQSKLQLQKRGRPAAGALAAFPKRSNHVAESATKATVERLYSDRCLWTLTFNRMA
jgi:hypothetical protein